MMSPSDITIIWVGRLSSLNPMLGLFTICSGILLLKLEENTPSRSKATALGPLLNCLSSGSSLSILKLILTGVLTTFV